MCFTLKTSDPRRGLRRNLSTKSSSGLRGKSSRTCETRKVRYDAALIPAFMRFGAGEQRKKWMHLKSSSGLASQR